MQNDFLRRPLLVLPVVIIGLLVFMAIRVNETNEHQQMTETADAEAYNINATTTQQALNATGTEVAIVRNMTQTQEATALAATQAQLQITEIAGATRTQEAVISETATQATAFAIATANQNTINANQTQTQQAIFLAQTETQVANFSNATATQQALYDFQTATAQYYAYLTMTPPTPTWTPSPTATPFACQTKIIGADVSGYSAPSRGANIINQIGVGTNVTLMSKLPDPTWSLIQYAGQLMWVQSDSISLTDANCDQVFVRPLLNQLADQRGISTVLNTEMFNDMFNITDPNWEIVSPPGPQVAFERDAVTQTYLMFIDAVTERYVFKLESVTGNQFVRNSFTAFSVTRANFSTGAYVGLQFWLDPDNDTFYEVRLNADCSVALYSSSNGQLESSPLIQQNPITDSSCGDQYMETYVEVYVEDNVLRVEINGQQMLQSRLEPLGSAPRGQIRFVVNETRAKYSFIMGTGAE